MQTLRFADPLTVQHYPLEISGKVDWQPIAQGWQAAIELDDLEAGSILTPSLSVLGDPDYRHQFTLHVDGTAYSLPPVPWRAGVDHHDDPSDRRVRTAIDCFHLDRPAQHLRLLATFSGTRMPQRYLLSVSARRNEIDPQIPDALPAVRTSPPPTHSQMLENPRIAGGICSPVSTAMAIRLHRPSSAYGTVIRDCFDPRTGMYGVWPLAIRAAARQGLIGAVELLSEWNPVITCLQAGLPLVASIRYGAGELTGSPQPATGGHLVLVHGCEDGEVLVNDPAAPGHGTVARRYPLAEFTRAWFRYRGAAYILTP